MNYEYYYNFNIMLFNVLYFKKPEINLFNRFDGVFSSRNNVTFTIQIID
jgi:hypothetical protein